MAKTLLVLSQDSHHVAVFKPHNIAVIGGPGVPRPTLLDLVRERFGKNIYPVHRLDRVTSGITIFARSQFSKHALDNAFKRRLVHKSYYAICEGKASFVKITINKSLKKVRFGQKKSGPQFRQIIDDHGQEAITKLSVIRQIDDNHVLIEANPISGRMHQIRAHLTYLGLPIVGDKLYGAKSSCAPHTIALCAVAITLPLPKGGKLSLDARQFFNEKEYLNPKTVLDFVE